MEEDTTSWVNRSLRFTSELDQWIIERAKTNLRSINAEITHILMKEQERESEQ